MSDHHLHLDLNRLAKIKDGTGHAIFSPSGSAMWLNCSGSLIPNILAPDEAGPDAAYGTVAHALTEEWLREEFRPYKWIGRHEFLESGKWGHLVIVDEEMFDHAQQCVDRSSFLPGDHFVEQRVNTTHLMPIPNQGGTLDFAAAQPGRAVLDDHKFGSSPDNRVDAEENSQLMLYASGFNAKYQGVYGLKDFIVRINQPRLNHFDEWHFTLNRLYEFEAYVKERAAAAWKLDAPRTPGVKQCRFCAIRGTCTANAAFHAEMTAGVFADETPTVEQTVEQMQGFVDRLEDDLEPFRLHYARIGELTTAQLARLYPFRKANEAHWKALELELQSRSVKGERIPGFKVVESRSRRVFNDKQKALHELNRMGVPFDELVEEKMVSPNQAGDLLVKHGQRRRDIPKLLTGLIHKPPGKATLAPLSDPRPELVDLASLVFEDAATHETDEDL